MSLVNTYTTLQDVRRVLRASPPSGRIRFSESYSVLKKSVDNTGTVELLKLRISEEYADVANYHFIFGNDSTTFTMYKIDTEKQSSIPLGVGIKQNDFTSSDGYFKLDATSWIGYTFPGDTIQFMTDSHMSLVDGSSFIMDAEVFVDSVLEKNIRFSNTVDTLRFPIDSTSVPKMIQLATSRIAAYFIYKSIFLENLIERTQENIASGWLKEGLEILSSYVSRWNLALSTSAPLLGHSGSSSPVDLDSDYVFKSSEFNLYIPINNFYAGLNDININTEAYNFINSSNYQNSVAADIADLCNT